MTSIAIVNSMGVVSGLALGTATITYFVANTCGSANVVTTVTVFPQPTAGVVTGATDVCLDSAIQLSASIPGGTWTKSSSIASFTGTGLVTGLTAGIDTVIYSVTNVCGTDNAAWPVNIVLCDVTKSSIVPDVFTELSVFPNPNAGAFTICGSLGTQNVGQDDNISLEITNMLGQAVYRSKVIATNGSLNERITIGNKVANGIYLLNVVSGTASKVFHITICQ